MVRYQTDTSPTYIAYGRDGNTGVFLSVWDRRLTWRDGDSVEITNLANKRFGGGEGRYLDLQTNPIGGSWWEAMREMAPPAVYASVSPATMAVYFKRYGVPRNHIVELLGEQYA